MTMILNPPFSEIQLQGFRGYFSTEDKGDQYIRQLCDAIRDKEQGGMGILWESTDFDKIAKHFKDVPRGYWSKQVAVALLKHVRMLEANSDDI